MTAPATAPPAPWPTAPPIMPPRAPPTIAPATGSCAAAGCAGNTAASPKNTAAPIMHRMFVLPSWSAARIRSRNLPQRRLESEHIIEHRVQISEWLARDPSAICAGEKAPVHAGLYHKLPPSCASGTRSVPGPIATCSRPKLHGVCAPRAVTQDDNGRRDGHRVLRSRALPSDDRDETLKVFLQNLLDSMLIAFMWGISRCWSVRVD